MRVVGGTEYISRAEQQKYFQWAFTDLASETCAELLQISWATFVFIDKNKRFRIWKYPENLSLLKQRSYIFWKKHSCLPIL